MKSRSVVCLPADRAYDGRVVRFPPLALAVAFVAAGLVFAACEKPDASDTTSPSAIALVGSATGNVAYNPPERPPELPSVPAGWKFDVGNARFSSLENGVPSIQVVTEIKSQPGPGMEVWLADESGTTVRWSGGSARPYNGVVCFQLRLQDKGESLSLSPSAHYTLTILFRDPGTGDIVAGQTIALAGRPPVLNGSLPAQGSAVARDLLGCPRSVI
jgi:hypothetical protein